jgi:hypothetical protein
MLVELISGALGALPSALGNMLAVLGAALLSVAAVSFFRAELTTFRTVYVLIIFLGGTFSPIVGILGGASSVLVAQRRRQDDQRELLILFSLLLLAIVHGFGLVKLGVTLDSVQKAWEGLVAQL